MSKEKVRYVGNKATKEFHRLAAIKPECNFDSIKPENKVEFKRGRDAKAKGFDACAFCQSYWKSRDNK